MNIMRMLPAVGLVLLVLTACGDSEDSPPPDTGELVVDYPLTGSVFPPEFVPPTFLWHDDTADVVTWRVEFAFADGERAVIRELDGPPPPTGEIDPAAVGENNVIYEGTDYQRSAHSYEPDAATWSAHSYEPDAATWEEIKRRSVEQAATVTFTGHADKGSNRVRSRGSIRVTTSKDPVGAPIFYRDVPLPPSIGEKGTVQPIARDALPLIAWRIRDVGRPESRVVLKNMPSCANCHSFSNDGKTLAMDVDGPQGDKGAYMIAPVEDEMVITNERVMTWSSFPGKKKGHRTLGFLSRISPDGAHVVSTVNEALYVQNFTDFRILQVFYPTRGILAWYDTETGQIKALPGADDTDYVQCCGVWTPDGKTIVFCRARAFDPYPPGQEPAEYAGDPKEPRIRYDLYRMPFNEGRGGTPVPIEGASGNGMSNSFPKVSPDGKWVVWTRCANGLLLRPDGRLWIVPLKGGEAREMKCNTSLMNSWHSFSPNGRWLVFSSKSRTPYTQMFLTHIDEDGNDTPAILIPNATAANRAVNIPEFLNAPTDAIRSIDVPAVSHHRLYQQARKLIKAEKFVKAVALTRQALEVEPDFARAQVLLGWALVRTEQVDEGMREIRKVIRDIPTNPDGHRYLGLSLAFLGRMNEAVGPFERAVSLSPGDWDAWKGLGQAQFELGDLSKSRFAFERAVDLEPGDVAAQESLAAVLLRLGLVARAVTHLERVCALAPQDVDPRLYLALYLATSADAKVRNGKRAIEVATEACELTDWKRPDALDLLAAAYAETGRWDEAMNTVKRAIAIAGKDHPSLVPGLRARLGLYEKKMPYHQPATPK